MCVFLGPARASKTVVYAGEISRLGIHTLAYQNVVANGFQTRPYAGPRRVHFSDGGSTLGLGRAATKRAVANAMILHFPSDGPMGPENMIDASDSPGFLDDIAAAIPSYSDTRGPMMKRLRAEMPDVQIFSKGSYTTALARDAHYIPQALSALSARGIEVLLNESIFYAYSEWFPHWPVALCCFTNSEEEQAEPLFWWYKPRNRNVLFVPTLDAHDGNVPDLDGLVDVDHTVAFSSDRLTNGNKVSYRGPITPKVRHYLPQQVIGMKIQAQMTNGDIVCDVSRMLDENAFDDPMRRVTPTELVTLVS